MPGLYGHTRLEDENEYETWSCPEALTVFLSAPTLRLAPWPLYGAQRDWHNDAAVGWN
jgi:hypothetical protein